ncbi:MAG: hypothetical protein O6944_11215 [Gammaproteobacteria bacterium]|nr:hypothetical protein [Gammaproteobacteria bacterium]
MMDFKNTQVMQRKKTAAKKRVTSKASKKTTRKKVAAKKQSKKKKKAQRPPPPYVSLWRDCDRFFNDLECILEMQQVVLPALEHKDAERKNASRRSFPSYKPRLNH